VQLDIVLGASAFPSIYETRGYHGHGRSCLIHARVVSNSSYDSVKVDPALPKGMRYMIIRPHFR
jgi:hypothetical protein